MTNASDRPTEAAATTNARTIDRAEAAHFGALAADWWDPAGQSAMLHRLNPARLGYIRDRLLAHWGGDAAARRPLAGRRALDVGCGGGLLAEPLARLGATVTAIDAAPEAIAVARAHAADQGLAIDYRAGEVATLIAEHTRFDLVTALEVVEHVADVDAFLAALGTLLAPGGLLILSTPNRTAKSRLLTVTLAEATGAVPRGTHDWHKFLTPDELTARLTAAGFEIVDLAGLEVSLSRGFSVGDDMGLGYFVTARR
jgi:2-polyprenyl-6-hydroxyphenyl methylase/3-demethylubiquinone-9 3-methyltransferase